KFISKARVPSALNRPSGLTMVKPGKSGSITSIFQFWLAYAVERNVGVNGIYALRTSLRVPVSYTRPKGRVLWRTGLQETVMSGSVGAQRKSSIARPDNPK
ncbi:TPA: hypothetical protein ACX14M_005739, partial [Citrobacter freundii]